MTSWTCSPRVWHGVATARLRPTPRLVRASPEESILLLLLGVWEQLGLYPVEQELDGEALGICIVFDSLTHRLIRLARDDDQVRRVVAVLLRLARKVIQVLLGLSGGPVVGLSCLEFNRDELIDGSVLAEEVYAPTAIEPSLLLAAGEAAFAELVDLVAASPDEALEFLLRSEQLTLRR